jgi:hypothetical protein
VPWGLRLAALGVMFGSEKGQTVVADRSLIACASAVSAGARTGLQHEAIALGAKDVEAVVAHRQLEPVIVTYDDTVGTVQACRVLLGG